MSETCLRYRDGIIHLWNEEANIYIQFPSDESIKDIFGAEIKEGYWLSVFAETHNSDVKRVDFDLLRITEKSFDLKDLLGSVNVLKYKEKLESDFILTKVRYNDIPAIKVSHCADSSLYSIHNESTKKILFSTMTTNMISRYLFNLVQEAIDFVG